MAPKRPPKPENALTLIREKFSTGHFRDTRHSAERKFERNISLLEIKQVIARGRHEKNKDEYREEYKSWNLVVRGRTIDERELRIVVSFEEECSLIVVSAIDLRKGEKEKQ